MNQNWYRTQDWYAPLVTEEQELPVREKVENPEPEEPEKKKKPSKGWTPGRILGLTAVLLLIIAGSSLAFSNKEGESSKPSLPDIFSNDDSEGKSEMPSSPEEFFEQYYEDIETDDAEVQIEKTDERPDFRMRLVGAEDEELSLQEIYEKCAPSIVAISGYEGKSIGYNWGSGVVISEDGIILTNTHVVEDCDRATVTLDDDRVFDAVLIGADAISDIAILKIDADGLVPAEFGESSSLKVGDRVAAIGNPLGESFRNTLTDGIISAIERGMTYHGRSMTLLQTNTAINEGNSGGALFNRYGQVIGITNMKMMSSYSSIEGIGFAIPSATVCTVVNALLRDGEVKGRPAIGITVGSIPANAMEQYDLPKGLYISAVSEGSDAQKQGIRPGDIVLEVNGKEVTTTTEINDMKNELQVGDTMTFKIWRDGEILEVTITLMDTNDVY